MPTINSPVSQWKLNDDAADTDVVDTMGSNDGTASANTSTLTTTGKINEAFDFNGVDEYIQIPDDSFFDFSVNDDFSFTCWVKIPATQLDTTSEENVIVEKWAGSGSYPFAFRLSNQTSVSSGRVVIARYDGSLFKAVQSSSTLNDDEWHFISFIKSGTSIEIFIDAVSEDSDIDVTGDVINNSDLYFARRGGVTENWYKGGLDDIRLYDFALNIREIEAIYNSEEGTEDLNPTIPDLNSGHIVSIVGSIQSTLNDLSSNMLSAGKVFGVSDNGSNLKGVYSRRR